MSDLKNEDIVAEHQLHYEIYYNELSLFYQKNSFFSTIQLALLSGVILKFQELVLYPEVMLIGLVFLIFFTTIQLFVSIRGNHVNDAVIGVISTFEKEHSFTFLNDFANELKKGNKIQKMNFPSLAIIATNILYLLVWCSLLIFFMYSHLPKNFFSPIFVKIASFALPSGKIKTLLVVIFSCLFAITMKIADMHDEHGMHLFKHADILFGFCWGAFGAVLVLMDTATANAIFAMMLGYVIRRRLDYTNHIIAFSIVSGVFLLSATLIKETFFAFWVSFTFLGMIKDLKYLNKPGKIASLVRIIYLYIPLIYALPTLIYGIIYNDWYAFCSMFMFDLSYNITRLVSQKQTWYKDEQITQV